MRESSWLSGSFVAASWLDVRRLLVRRRQQHQPVHVLERQLAVDEFASPASRAAPGASAVRRGGRSRSASRRCRGRSGAARAGSRSRGPSAGCRLDAIHFASASRRPVLFGSGAIVAATGLPPGESDRGEAGLHLRALVARARRVRAGTSSAAGRAGRSGPSRPAAAAASWRRTSSSFFLQRLDLRAFVGGQRLRDLGVGHARPSPPSRRRVPAARRCASPAACGARPAPPARASRASPRRASCGAVLRARRSRRGASFVSSRYSRCCGVVRLRLGRGGDRTGRGGTRPG